MFPVFNTSASIIKHSDYLIFLLYESSALKVSFKENILIKFQFPYQSFNKFLQIIKYKMSAIIF